jgi:succinate dehydrogenase/fumarate reductase-like Fe-S protein
MLFFGTKAYSEAKAYEKTTHLLIAEMSAEKLAKFQLKELAATVSLGFYKNKAKETLKRTTAWLHQSTPATITIEVEKRTETQSDCILCDSCYSQGRRSRSSYRGRRR